MEKVLRELKNIAKNDPEQYDLYKLSIPFTYTTDHPTSYDPNLPRLYDTRIYVTDRDCLEVSAVLATLENSQHPLILNMANSYNCGGSFSGYGGSQEEYLIRNTTLIASLWPHRRENDNRWKIGNKFFTTRSIPSYYPFTNCGGVYTPYVRVFNYHHTCSIISLAQQDLRSNSSYSSPSSPSTFDYEMTIQNFRSLFSIAFQNGHNALVLGAIGCGAFRNPPREICRAFHELLQPGGEFHNVFDIIVFAIIKSEENLNAFEEIFGSSVELESVLFP